MSTVELTIEPFDLSRGDAAMTGMRGVMLDGPSRSFPTVVVCDNGNVEMGEDVTLPGEDAEHWFRAVADAIAARRAAVGGQAAS